MIFFLGLVVLSPLAGAPPAGATVVGIVPGDLVKIQNDHDPATSEDAAVYYVDTDLRRRPFPNQRVYDSWYRDFSAVKEITREEMAGLWMGGPILYRPGTRLVKIPSIPKVYAVEPGGLLRWVETETVAIGLYGPDWAKRVDDLPESFFTAYVEGVPLTAAVWPTGTFISRASDAALFLIDGATKRHITPNAAVSSRVDHADAITVADADLSQYADGLEITEGDIKLTDTSQINRIETLSPPVFDFPASVGDLTASREKQGIAAFRLTSSAPVIIRRLEAVVTGPFWSSGQPGLSNLNFIDAFGTPLFGSVQLAVPGASSERLVWSGAYTMPENSLSLVELKADVGGMVDGSTVTATIDKQKIELVDGGGNGQPVKAFYPEPEFPTFASTVRR